MQTQFAGYMSQQLGNFPADALQIFYIGGGGVVLNWIFGAIAFIASIKVTSKLTATLKKAWIRISSATLGYQRLEQIQE